MRAVLCLLSACGLVGCAEPAPAPPAATPDAAALMTIEDSTPEPTPEPLPEIDVSALVRSDPTPTPTPAPVRKAAVVPDGKTHTTSQIKGTIQRNMPQIRACYERQLKASPSLAGKVVMGWTLRADGAVEGARAVANSTRSSALAKCMASTMARWRFGKAEASSDVEYPFVFKSEGGF